MRKLLLSLLASGVFVALAPAEGRAAMCDTVCAGNMNLCSAACEAWSSSGTSWTTCSGFNDPYCIPNPSPQYVCGGRTPNRSLAITIELHEQLVNRYVQAAFDAIPSNVRNLTGSYAGQSFDLRLGTPRIYFDANYIGMNMFIHARWTESGKWKAKTFKISPRVYLPSASVKLSNLAKLTGYMSDFPTWVNGISGLPSWVKTKINEGWATVYQANGAHNLSLYPTKLITDINQQSWFKQRPLCVDDFELFWSGPSNGKVGLGVRTLFVSESPQIIQNAYYPSSSNWGYIWNLSPSTYCGDPTTKFVQKYSANFEGTIKQSRAFVAATGEQVSNTYPNITIPKNMGFSPSSLTALPSAGGAVAYQCQNRGAASSQVYYWWDAVVATSSTWFMGGWYKLPWGGCSQTPNNVYQWNEDCGAWGGWTYVKAMRNL